MMPASPPDPLTGLALRIARRADELARKISASPKDVLPWLLAEEEVLGERLPQPHLPATIAPPMMASSPQ